MFRSTPASAMSSLSKLGLALYLPDVDLVAPLAPSKDVATSLVCIYCRAATTGSEPPDHPCLQALGTRRFPLPRGAVCFWCNQYLKELDYHVCNHHHLATMIVFGGITGQNGRRRQTVYEHFRFDITTQTVS